MARMTRRTTKNSPRPFRDLALSMGATWYLMEDSRAYDIGPFKSGVVDSATGTQLYDQPPLAPGLGKSFHTSGGWLQWTGRNDAIWDLQADFSWVYWTRPNVMVNRGNIIGFPHGSSTYGDNSIFHFINNVDGQTALALINGAQETMTLYDEGVNQQTKDMLVGVTNMFGITKPAGATAPVTVQDGSSDLDTTAPTNQLSNLGQLKMGGNGSSFWNEYNGWISDVVVFQGKLLSAAEMTALYRAGQGQF